jgi:hypothetical protein
MRTLLLALTLAGAAFGQPDVVQTGTFTAVANGAPLFVGAGGPNGAVVWRLTFFVDGTNITAAQMAIQGAAAPTLAGCSSASYATITTAGPNAVEVANPSASGPQGNVGAKAYFPCIRVAVTGITGSAGTVTYQLLAWKNFFLFPGTTGGPASN